MSPIGKIRISVFLLGILICLLVASVNGQQAGGNGNEGGGNGNGDGGNGNEGGRNGNEGGGNGNEPDGSNSEDSGSNSEEGGNSSEEERPGRGRSGERRGPGGPGKRGPGYYKKRKPGQFSAFFEESSDVPSFCQQKACPKFTVTSQTEDYELRKYAETKWLTVDKPGSFRGRFRILIKYLNGSNAENKKLKIGVPVLKEYVGDNTEPERKLFYTSETNPPAPEDDAVKIVTIPGGLRYVKTFGDYATPKDIADNKKLLIEKISGGYDDSFYYAAIFNSPFQRTDRHNEIWVRSTQAPN